jgi:hypothetical protein
VTDLLGVLQAFYDDKLSSLLRHTAAARLVTQYDANNTYQHIIGREEGQLGWVAQAIVALGGSVPVAGPEPDRGRRGKDADLRTVFEEDARDARAFVDRWRPLVDAMTNARHRGMLRVILGETLEQARFFDQALAGRTDLLGRRTEGVGALVGDVLATRWIE